MTNGGSHSTRSEQAAGGGSRSGLSYAAAWLLSISLIGCTIPAPQEPPDSLGQAASTRFGADGGALQCPDGGSCIDEADGQDTVGTSSTAEVAVEDPCPPTLGIPGGDQVTPITDEVMASSESFWDPFRLQADWVEGYASIEEAAQEADIVGMATVVSLLPPRVIQGDAPEDVFTEEYLLLQMDDILHGDPGQCFLVVTLVAPRQFSDQERAQLRSRLPLRPVLVLLRRRAPGIFTLINGFGLWAPTQRSEVDCAIELFDYFLCEEYVALTGERPQSLVDLADRLDKATD